MIQRQSALLLFWRLTMTLVGFVSTIYFARTLGASVLGSYFLFLAYYGIFTLVVDGGFGEAAVKRISEGLDPNAFFTAFLFQRIAFVAILLSILIIVRSYFVDLNDSGLFVWLLLLLVVSIFTGGVMNGLYGRGKTGVRESCVSIGQISKLFIQIIAIFLGFGVAGLAGGMLAGTIFGGVIGLHFLDLKLARFGWSHIKSLFTFSFWLILTSGGGLIFAYADTVLIGYFLDNVDVGIYRIAFQMTSFALLTTTAMRTTLYPKISNWGKSGKINLVEMSLAKAFTYSLILAIPMFVGGVLLGDKLLYFLYGATFAKGANVLMILLAVQIANVFMFFFTMSLNALDSPKEAFKVSTIAAAINIILDILLIPIYGIEGAALATLATMTLNAILAKRALSRIITLRIELKSLSNILLASIFMALIIGSYRLFVPLNSVWLTILPVIIGAIVYAFIVLKLDKNIHEELHSIVTQFGVPWPRWL